MLAISWFLVGGIDLLCALMLLAGRPLFGIFAVAIGLVSFVVSFRLGSALDTEVFRADLDTNVSYFDCKPSISMMILGGVWAVLFWVVFFWIIIKGFFPRSKPMQANVAPVT